MSLEAKIDALTTAVNALVNVMSNGNQPVKTEVTTTPPQVTEMINQTKPQDTATTTSPASPAVPPTTAEDAAPAVNMPTPPNLDAPATTAPAGVPFSDATGLVNYVMDAYKAIGAEKGAQIGNILAELGYQNINDVKPEHYGVLHEKVEALKA